MVPVQVIDGDAVEAAHLQILAAARQPGSLMAGKFDGAVMVGKLDGVMA
ncbi:hypothetical protein ART_2801 [Arthrobacter sp. PAMC 25486]|nr:hypothetical protein ART_2801 [Arthrobacter sp. PAMC 25486]